MIKTKENGIHKKRKKKDNKGTIKILKVRLIMSEMVITFYWVVF